MEVRRVPTEDPAAVRRFVRLERELMKDFPLWVAPTESAVAKVLAGPPALHEGIEHALFAVSNRTDIARCAAFVNRRWQRHHGETAGFLGHFAAASGAHREVRALLASAEEWLVERGATSVIAGYNGICGTGLGIRTSEFDAAVCSPEPWHPPYYAEYLEECGYERFRPWLSWCFDLRNDTTRLVMDLVTRRRLCIVRTIDRRRWQDELSIALEIFNECFQDAWDYYPLTAEELGQEMDTYRALADPRQVLIAEVNGKAAGMCMGSPDYAPLLRKLRGKMGPLQRIRFSIGARRVRHGSPSTLAVLPEYRGKHVGHTLLATLFKHYADVGMTDLNAVFTDRENTQMVSLLDSFGGTRMIRYHTFNKEL